MKKFLSLPVLLFGFILGSPEFCLADDSGEEKTVPVIEWACWSCNKHFFTFAPDTLDAKIIQHKDPNFQQSKWLILKTRNPIKKCEKMFDGAHTFDKKREFMTSGYVIMNQADTFVVIKGGQAIKATVNKVQCVGCDKGAYAFKGDDLDQWGFLTLGEASTVFAMKSGSKIGNCEKLKLPFGTSLKPHLFELKGDTSMSSDSISQYFGSFLCSD